MLTDGVIELMFTDGASGSVVAFGGGNPGGTEVVLGPGGHDCMRDGDGYTRLLDSGTAPIKGADDATPRTP